VLPVVEGKLGYIAAVAVGGGCDGSLRERAEKVWRVKMGLQLKRRKTTWIWILKLIN